LREQKVEEIEMKDRAAREKLTEAEPKRVETPADWLALHREVAEATNLAIAIAAPGEPTVAAHNDNSICRAFKRAHAHLCQPFCGRALERARAEGVARYQCHAGLRCVAVPVKIQGRELAAVGGRAFQFSADYRAFALRVRTGELEGLELPDLFRNVLFTTEQRFEQLVEKLRALSVGDDQPGEIIARASAPRREEKAFDDLILEGEPFRKMCQRLGEKLSARLELKSLALLVRLENSLVVVYASGRFVREEMRLDSTLFGDAAERSSTLVVEAEGKSGRARGIELFALRGSEGINGALAVETAALDEEKRRAVRELCKRLAPDVEIMRLREEIMRRRRAMEALQAFLERAAQMEQGDLYTAILQHAAELFQSERSSLLVYDEKNDELVVRAAVGPHADIVRVERVPLNASVAGRVMHEGQPLLVKDFVAEKQERTYRTRSFISYPLAIGQRKVGVLNLTDKRGGGTYDEFDLHLLHLVAPQITLALENIEWRRRAEELLQLSITDPLTELHNRRYLETRIAEEFERAKRYGPVMSFMMIDIDDFKLYNDRYGHQAGDEVIKRVASCLRQTLRSADLPARYGGEEFSVLLPQTGLTEAGLIAERVRQRIRQQPYRFAETQPFGTITVSIGVASSETAFDSAEAIIKAADDALYAAKRRGKDQVVVYADGSEDAPGNAK